MHNNKLSALLLSVALPSLGLPAVALSLSAGLLGCATSGVVKPRTGPTEDLDECPEPPGLMTSIAQLQLISRVTREARANLLVQGTLDGQRVVATLHPPRLALAEGVLAGPRRARRRDPRWMALNIDTTFVDLQCAKPLPSLERSPASVVLRDGKGNRSPLLTFSRQQEGSRVRYRLVFAPPSGQDGERTRWTLQLPAEPKPISLGWSLAAANQERFDGLPLLFALADQRAEVRARRAALEGDVRRGLRLLDDVLDCSSAPEPAKALAAGLRIKLKPARTVQIPLSTRRDDEPGLAAGRAPDGSLHRGLSLRVAIARVLAPSAARGLIDGAGFARAVEQLRRAASHAADGKRGEAITLLLAHDRGLARLLREAMRAGGKPHVSSAPIALSASGAEQIPPKQVVLALRGRIAAAVRGLEPRWISAAGQRSPEDVRPLLVAKTAQATIFAMPTELLGAGFWHQGLRPKRAFAISFVDIGRRHWQRLAARAKGQSGLRALAQRVLARERYGNEPARRLAVHGLVALAKQAAQLQPLLTAKETAKHALRALAQKRASYAEATLLSHARGADLDRKRAAVQALGWRAMRGLASGGATAAWRATLRNNLGDSDPTTSALAALGLATTKERAAVRLIAGWLRAGSDRGDAIRRLFSAPSKALIGALGGPLRRALRDKRTPALVSTLAKLGDRASLRDLRRLYKKPALRPMLLAAAIEAHATPLLALPEPSEQLALALKRRVVVALSATPRGQKARLQAWLSQSKDALIRAAAQVGLARLEQGSAVLALGALARGSCQLRTLVVPVLAPSMDRSSRRRLLLDALAACPKHASTLWKPVATLQSNDLELLRAGLGHRRPQVRVQAALTALGLRRGAATLELPRFD
jgi:hypothetical protein